MELSLVSLHLSDEVDEVLGLLELVKVLSINNVAKLIFNLDNKLNNIEGVETVVLELGIKSNLVLLGGTEVVLDDAKDVLGNLIVVLENEGILLCLDSILPESNFATLASDSNLG
jgi:hypothetical protein